LRKGGECPIRPPPRAILHGGTSPDCGARTQDNASRTCSQNYRSRDSPPATGADPRSRQFEHIDWFPAAVARHPLGGGGCSPGGQAGVRRGNSGGRSGHTGGGRDSGSAGGQSGRRDGQGCGCGGHGERDFRAGCRERRRHSRVYDTLAHSPARAGRGNRWKPDGNDQQPAGVPDGRYNPRTSGAAEQDSHGLPDGDHRTERQRIVREFLARVSAVGGRVGYAGTGPAGQMG
jgi:hypothetical protein